MEGPCIIIITSSAKTTISRVGAAESSAIGLLMTMFHKVGPDTDRCAQPLVTCLEVDEVPSVT
jgi:hypothetical protein